MVCRDKFGNSCNKTITLHLKILTAPITFTIQQMLNEMIKLYGSLTKIQVNVASTESLSLPHLTELMVGDCRHFGTTNQQNQLFNNRNNMEENHIAVYFIRRTVPAYSGCAAYLPNKPSCVIVKDASLWTLAHEVGHVIGLSGHPDEREPPTRKLYKRLMTSGGTANIQNPPPDLIQSEINTMTSSSLCKNC